MFDRQCISTSQDMDTKVNQTTLFIEWVLNLWHPPTATVWAVVARCGRAELNRTKGPLSATSHLKTTWSLTFG